MAPTHAPVDLLYTDEAGLSRWRRVQLREEVRGGMLLSCAVPLGATLRLRASPPGYFADWHLSNETVLIIVLRGTLRIGLRDGHRDFSAGDRFVAADSLPAGTPFDAVVHGHTAEVVGADELEAVHVKLAPGLEWASLAAE
mmetsp:Transcript_9445/g.23607  ORF Transcript_9445/g.23607 Transcript_9445/m.23607 type:complete len:141 (-) Transcript_9445:344-766(-)|eukprot:CAMPEP_0177631096 /NCGR_PEP_ID=MMETSP0447-20121125/1565_1 /TAXON_ID=0 /ORGANISM="Stygamoeba regulata, Strain BSH-02190019" /LENGTH=140 /DNA_ID=CAMNT_0019132553 /DNA_START=89 /DNA_END=511 /DNA_ORIENTATION=+